jgi:hypothetical protein
VSVKYLLPCRCGQQIAVEPRQAGETAVCSCGQSLPIPTMLEMSALELAPPEVSLPSQRAWGWCQRIMLLGGTLLIVAIVGGALLRWNRPVAPTDVIVPEEFRQSASHLTPVQTWHYWGLMKQGMDRRTDQIFAAALTRYHVWQSTAAVMALAGIVLIGLGVAMKKRQGAASP